MYHVFWDNILLFKKLYGEALDPVAQACGLNRMKLDLLLFLHNNPEYSTASEAVRLRRWTKSHVSAAVHSLEEKGLLTASHPPGNRKTLCLTPLTAADNVIRQGVVAQNHFIETLSKGTTPEELILVEQVVQKIAWNIREVEKSEVIYSMFTFIICFLAGIGAGLGTGFAGMSAAAVISPMLITFLHMEPYEAVGIALASDILASAVSAYTYHKNKNLDVKNGLVMMGTVLVFTLVGSWVSSLVPSSTMGGFSTFMTLLLGIKFIVKPVMTTKESMEAVDSKKRVIQSIMCGIMIGFVCGFVGAGGGIMMLLILTSVLGYELKTAVGTSVFIMTFTALTGSLSHFVIGGMPDLWVLLLCVLSTLLWARIAARFANKANPIVLNRATGAVLVVLGAAILIFNQLQ